MAGVNFNITVVHKNGTGVYNIQVNSATFQMLLSVMQNSGSYPGSIDKTSGSDGTGNEIGFSLTEGGNAVDLSASIYTTVGGNDTTIYALYLEPEIVTGFFLDGAEYKFAGGGGGGDESNTKTFYISSTSDLTTAQAAYDWYLANKNPIIVYDNVTYIVISKITSGIYFGATLLNGGSNSYSATYECGIKSILFNLSGDTVDRIYINSTYAPIGGAKEFLALHQNYSTPYTPEYPGSPATKKYVDDIKPTSGSTAPSTTPTFVGQQYVDTTADKMYVATGTSSSSDWMEVGAGSGDMSYSDFSWQAKTGATVTLDLASTITPSANFTVNAPSTIKDGQTYILRVSNGATVYTMTLGTNITNPYSVDTTLTASGIDQFVFLAIGGNLELQPDTNQGGGGGGSGGFGTLLASYADVAAPTTLTIPAGTKLVVLETDRGGKMNTIFISADTLLSQGVDRQYSTYGYTDYDSFVTVNYDFSAGTFKVVGYNWSSAPNVYFYG